MNLMAGKETLRKALGESGDYSEELHNMFGEAYDDGPDDTQEVPSDLEEAAEVCGARIFNITELYKRFNELTPKISCQENQEILRRQITGRGASFLEVHATTLHHETCEDKVCTGLNKIAVQDIYYTPAQLTKMARERGLL